VGVPRLKERSACADKNDKIGWECGFSRSINGLTLGIRTNDENYLSELLARLPVLGEASDEEAVENLISIKFGKTRRKGTRDYHLLYDGWTQLARTLDLEVALRAFTVYASQRVAEAAYLETLIVHAGFAVETQGNAVAVFGDSQEINMLRVRLDEVGSAFFSENVVTLNRQGLVRPLAGPGIKASVHESKKLCVAYFLEDVETPTPLTQGQGALRVMIQAVGNAPPRGEMEILASAFSGCKVWAWPLSDRAGLTSHLASESCSDQI